MINPCVHCGQNETVAGEQVCSDCARISRCAGCTIFFGNLVKPSKENPMFCDSCLELENNILFYCQGCHKQLPLFYSPNTNTLHFVVRGNFCGHCNNTCAIEARNSVDNLKSEPFMGYLEILFKQIATGNISKEMFDEAMFLNPQDVKSVPKTNNK